VELEVQPRSAHEIRNRFLSKLVLDRVWKNPAKKGTPHQSITIFDWDDTLFCTSAFHPQNERDVDRIGKFHAEICKELDK
jgi:hypothetical protein